MMAPNPNVPRWRLIWSLSCTVNAPSMIPAINIVVATTWRSDMGSHSNNTLPRPPNCNIQDGSCMFRSKHTQSMTEPIRAEISKSNQCDAEGHTVKASAPVLAMRRKLVEAGYILLRRFTLTEAIPFASRSADGRRGGRASGSTAVAGPGSSDAISIFWLIADADKDRHHFPDAPNDLVTAT